MSMILISHLLQSYGYLAVFLFVGLESVGFPLPGETTLIAAAPCSLAGSSPCCGPPPRSSPG
jgi:membrane protein DedA with SNARE-associated domain